MAMQPFTSNFADNSTEQGFQFTFYCDLCREGYKTRFVACRSSKKSKLLRNIGGIVGAAGSMTGKHRWGYGVQRGTRALTERFHGMSAEWQKEHEQAFAEAQNEAKMHFHRCPKCRKWVCDNDWNEQEGLCTNDAPRVNVEVAAARADKMAKDIKDQAGETQVFYGEIESKQTMCPRCGKPAGEGKFCTNCGGNLALLPCDRCGANNPAEAAFCGQCGDRLQ